MVFKKELYQKRLQSVTHCQSSGCSVTQQGSQPHVADRTVGRYQEALSLDNAHGVTIVSQILDKFYKS